MNDKKDRLDKQLTVLNKDKFSQRQKPVCAEAEVLALAHKTNVWCATSLFATVSARWHIDQIQSTSTLTLLCSVFLEPGPQQAPIFNPG